MNVLMIYPKYPNTYWSFKHALKFISKKAAVPPLGLITVSAMLPENWQKKLVDMNIEKPEDKDLEWADYIFLSGMYVQKDSVNEILDRCQNYSAKIIAGGPLFTKDYENYPQTDRFILNEAEITMADFLKDWQTGRLKRIYRTNEYKLVKVGNSDLDISRIKAFVKSVFVLGLVNKGRFEYWKFIVWTIFRKPKLFIDAVTLAVYGYHFRTVYGLKST